MKGEVIDDDGVVVVIVDNSEHYICMCVCVHMRARSSWERHLIAIHTHSGSEKISNTVDRIGQNVQHQVSVTITAITIKVKRTGDIPITIVVVIVVAVVVCMHLLISGDNVKSIFSPVTWLLNNWSLVFLYITLHCIIMLNLEKQQFAL